LIEPDRPFYFKQNVEMASKSKRFNIMEESAFSMSGHNGQILVNHKLLLHPPAVTTMRRWWMVGTEGNDGEIHKLQTKKIGGTRYTSVEAFKRWVDATNRTPKEKKSK